MVRLIQALTSLPALAFYSVVTVASEGVNLFTHIDAPKVAEAFGRYCYNGAAADCPSIQQKWYDEKVVGFVAIVLVPVGCAAIAFSLFHRLANRNREMRIVAPRRAENDSFLPGIEGDYEVIPPQEANSPLL